MSLRSAVHRGLEFYGYLPPVATPEARSQSGPFEYRHIGLENKEDIHADIEALNPILTSRARAGNGRHDGHRYEH